MQRIRIQRAKQSSEARTPDLSGPSAGLALLSRSLDSPQDAHSDRAAPAKGAPAKGAPAGHRLGDISVLPPGEYSVSQPGDTGELAANHLADQVLAMTPTEQGMVGGEEQTTVEGADINRQAINRQAIAPPAAQQRPAAAVQMSTGAPLADIARQTFEPRFGHDFSQVRIFADNQAARAAEALDARAFTVGSDIVFGAGQYAPESPSGQRLLAHELAHVVQGGSDVRTLHRWKDDGHIATTKEAANGVFSDADPLFTTMNIGKPTFVTRVANASLNMDRVLPHLGDRFAPGFGETKFWSFTATLLASGAKDLLPGNQRKGQTRRGMKGEGPDHGEAGYYDVAKSAAMAGNQQRTDHYVTLAVQAYTAGNYDETINKLGDACHVAADRGPHAEGGQGEGHDTRMPDPDKGEKGTNLKLGGFPNNYMENWADNDIVGQNPDGYYVGLAYTLRALGDFRNLTRAASSPKAPSTNPFDEL